MRIELFAIPVIDPKGGQEALNRFLSSRRIVAIDRHLVTENGMAMWAFCVTYLEGEGAAPAERARVDYKEILSPGDFEIFARLRLLRKSLAEQAGIPLFSVFTNDQLAEMVVRRVRTKAALGELSGVGESRVAKYGEAVLGVLRDAFGDAEPEEP